MATGMDRNLIDVDARLRRLETTFGTAAAGDKAKSEPEFRASTVKGLNDLIKRVVDLEQQMVGVFEGRMAPIEARVETLEKAAAKK